LKFAVRDSQHLFYFYFLVFTVGNLGLVDDLRLGQADLAELDEMYASKQFNNVEVARLRTLAGAEVQLPQEEGMVFLMTRPYWKRPWLLCDKPGWLSPIARLRHVFRCSALRFGHHIDSPTYLVCCVLQNPLQLSLKRLVRRDPTPMPTHLGFEMCLIGASQWRRFEWRVDSEWSFLHEFDFGKVLLVDVYVLPDLEYVGNSCYATSLDPIPLEHFIDQFEISWDRTRKIPTGEPPTDLKLAFAQREKHEAAWLQNYWRNKLLGTTGKRKEPGSHRVERKAAELAPEDEEAMATEVERLRYEWQTAHAERMKGLVHFEVDHVGTPWTWKHKAQAADKVRGVWKTDTGFRFLHNWGLQKEFGSSIELYDLDGAELFSVS